jgi:uncharacterized protein with von Willebrand factor type A (vWA) domain
MKTFKQVSNDDEQLDKLYKEFQAFTINEHLCDDDIASICTRWLKEYMIRQLTTMEN